MIFLFVFGRFHQKRASLNMPRVASLSDDMTYVGVMDEPPQCQRMGIMAAFPSLEAFKR